MTVFVNKPNTEPIAQVRITCLSTGEKVRFFPYDFEFDDIFKPEWGSYDGFGRMDPVMTYKRTSRTANLSFNVVAESKTKDLPKDLQKNPDIPTAENNFENLQKLIQGLYPIYNPLSATDSQFLLNKAELLRKEFVSTTEFFEKQNQSSEIPLQIQQELQKVENQITSNREEQNQAINDFGIRVIDRSPLLQISFMNLLNNQQYVVAVTNFKHKMKFDAGNTSLDRDGKAIPGEFNINMAFTILHTYIPGEKTNYNIGE